MIVSKILQKFHYDYTLGVYKNGLECLYITTTFLFRVLLKLYDIATLYLCIHNDIIQYFCMFNYTHVKTVILYCETYLKQIFLL